MSAALRRLDPSRSSALTPGRTSFFITAAASLFILFLPESGVPTAPAGSDKAVHVALFAALAATGGWAGFRSRVLLSALTGYAVLSEVVQHVLPLGRTGDPADALADVCGMAAGWVLANGVRRVARLSRRRSQRHG